MNFDFSLILLIAVIVSLAIILLDLLILKPARKKKVQEYLTSSGLKKEDWENYKQDPEESEKNTTDSVKTQLRKVEKLELESMPVEYAKSFFPVLFAVLIIRSFLFEPFQIPTGSMIPTLKVGDFIVVNKYSYGLRLPVVGTKVVGLGEPERGDVMVFIPPHDPTYYIKRVIGMPGDHIRYEGKMLYINGEPMEQEIVSTLQDGFNSVVYSTENLDGVVHDIHTVPNDIRFQGPGYWLPPEGRVIPDGHYFMMGDNRDNSDDSRRWGPVSEDKVVGKAIAVWMHKEPGVLLPSFSGNRLINSDK